MGKTLPGELVEVLDLVGVSWPNIDEDEVRGCAKDYRKLAEGLRDVITEGNNACSNIVGGRSKGLTVTAIDRRWGKLTSKDLTTFAKALDDLGDALDDCAALIEGCKVVCIAELGATAAAATAGVVGMFFTVGLSGLLSAGAILACRIALHEAIDYAVGEITSIVTDKIEAKILSKIEAVFTDHLDADDNPADYASGSADMAQDLVIEFDEFDRASGGYKETRDNFDKKKGEHKSGGGSRRSSVKKDSRFHKLSTVMDKAEDAVDKKADETVDILEKHGGNIDKSKKGHKQTDKERKEDLDRCKVDGGDDVPMYLLNADGTVEQLHADGRTPTKINGSEVGIRDILESDGTVWRSRATDKGNNPFGLSPSPDNPKVESKRLGKNQTSDLAYATQLARYSKGDYKGGNYAAADYVDADGNKVVLVGHSKGVHSERTIGYPVLKHGKESGIQSIYTEREPCQESGSWCDQWLGKHFGKNLEVSHSLSYDQSSVDGKRPSSYSIDGEHRAYRKNLEDWHNKNGLGAMMTESDGAQMETARKGKRG
ncbi:nucleic acid/nucleotide deaminase domain-containing protein [Streptomyces anulatus]